MTYNARVVTIPTADLISYAGKFFLGSADESPGDARQRRALFRNAVLTSMATAKQSADKRLEIFNDLLVAVNSPGFPLLGGSFSLFMSLCTDPSIRGPYLADARGAQLVRDTWNRAPKDQVSDAYEIMYHIPRDCIYIVPTAALQNFGGQEPQDPLSDGFSDGIAAIAGGAILTPFGVRAPAASYGEAQPPASKFTNASAADDPYVKAWQSGTKLVAGLWVLGGIILEAIPGGQVAGTIAIIGGLAIESGQDAQNYYNDINNLPMSDVTAIPGDPPMSSPATVEGDGGLGFSEGGEDPKAGFSEFED